MKGGVCAEVGVWVWAQCLFGLEVFVALFSTRS